MGRVKKAGRRVRMTTGRLSGREQEPQREQFDATRLEALARRARSIESLDERNVA